MYKKYADKPKRKAYLEKYRKENRDKIKKHRGEWLEKNASQYKQYRDKWYRDNKLRLQEIRLHQKTEVYARYGNRCNCCAETEMMFLSIDHVNNDGHVERKSRGGSSDTIIRSIIKQGFPDTYQLLCMNCNHGKARNGGVCPHSYVVDKD